MRTRLFSILSGLFGWLELIGLLGLLGLLGVCGCGGTPNRAPVVNLKANTRTHVNNRVMISSVRVIPKTTYAQPKKMPAPKPIFAHNKPQISLPLKQVHWSWPHKGRILKGFQASNTKGIDIGGIAGSAVKASAKGTVVYSGNGLKGYGNLIIIKHDEDFLSAYAHNDKLMVKEGERVISGQEIAKIGKTDTDQVKLHFEIRYKGKPVDPLQFLPKAF